MTTTPEHISELIAARDETVVRRQYTISSISFAIRFLIPCFMGIAAYAYLTGAGILVTEGAFTVDGEVIDPDPEKPNS